MKIKKTKQLEDNLTVDNVATCSGLYLELTFDNQDGTTHARHFKIDLSLVDKIKAIQSNNVLNEIIEIN